MKKMVDFFLFSSIFISSCAIAMVYQTLHLFHLPLPNRIFYLFVAGGTIASYNLHWYASNLTTVSENTPRYIWTTRFKSWLLPFAITGILIAAIAFYFLKEHRLYFIIGFVFPFLYTAPKFTFKHFTLLRKIAIGKTIYLALSWTYVTTLLPMLVVNVSIKSSMILFVGYRFFLIYAICILFDLRDKEEDKKQGIQSLITWLNSAAIKQLYYFSLLIAVIIIVFLYHNPFSLYIAAALLMPLFILSFLYRTAVKSKNDYLYYFFLDGLMIVSLAVTIW